MASYTNDPLHQKLVAVLIPLLRRTCPADAGGYGGSYELRLTAQEAEELGGVPLIRSAMRKAARELGWSKLQTYGMGPTGDMALAGVVDERQIPEEFTTVVERHRLDKQRAAAEAAWQLVATGRPHAVRGSAFVTTQEFRAAYSAADHA
ncbi:MULTISPECIES: hypothetical protein [Streptomycetaceae]|uniref:hypothetical protein n=1 Tax=Streptomycetaceae TaxID=2062 RepID=UPI000671111A|nr:MULTISPECIES: hypothetical protein [Streptomycetaceae]OKI00489.1 hypothetical protein AMK13_32865 [Streptomyces sp. CB02056]